MATFSPALNHSAERMEAGTASGTKGVNGGYNPGTFNPGAGMGPEDDALASMNRLRSSQSVFMSPELFEKLYLSPPTNVKGQLRKTFGNPTPIALVEFLLALTPLSCDLMEWRGSGGNGAASVGSYFFMGGLLMIIGGILEWVLGNTFASVVFSTFGGFWLSFGGTLVPSFNAYGACASPTGPVATGLATRGFNASIGFWLLFMGMTCLLFLICATRTNAVFVLIFFSLMLTFFLLTGAFWALAEDFASNAAIARRCRVGAGASSFMTSIAGWYLLPSIMLAAVDFPIQLPVGDLSTVVKGRSERIAARG